MRRSRDFSVEGCGSTQRFRYVPCFASTRYHQGAPSSSSSSMIAVYASRGSTVCVAHSARNSLSLGVGRSPARPSL